MSTTKVSASHVCAKGEGVSANPVPRHSRHNGKRGFSAKVLRQNDAPKKVGSADYQRFFQEQYDLSREASVELWDKLMTKIRSDLLNGCVVTLAHIGKISPYMLKETRYKDPKNGEFVSVDKRPHLRFVVSPLLKERLRA